MLVLGINKILNWCHITSGGRNYTCPTKLIDGKLFFHFKKEWYNWTLTANYNEETLATALDHELVVKFAKEFMEFIFKQRKIRCLR